MAEKKQSTPKKSILSALGQLGQKWRSEHTADLSEISQASTSLYGAGISTPATLLWDGRHKARQRAILYEKWMRMEGDPVVSSALMLLVTAALGGHETTGDLVFIEPWQIDAEENKALADLVAEIAADLSPLFNRIAFHIAYTGAAYGDAYCRIYAREGSGIVDLSCTELIRPQLVQPYERGERTVGFACYVGDRNFERLDITQMARMKMPRTQWVPQFGVTEKSLKARLSEDDIDKLPLMPAMAGGSLLFNAEEPYDNLSRSLLGLVNQRWLDSIDEQILTVNMASMSPRQADQMLESIKRILLASRAYAETAVKKGAPILEKIRHVIPVSNEKQLVQITGGMGSGRNASIVVEDILFHARMLAGALGVDLSMIGFADQMSGGLGEGGFFRTSAQAAERARVIRVALSEFFNNLIDIHTLYKYNTVFKPKNRPWRINFYGSISALEAEKQKTKSDAMMAGGTLAQTMQVVKDLGMDKAQMKVFLEKVMQLDADQAELFSTIVEKGAEEEEPGEEMPEEMPEGEQ